MFINNIKNIPNISAIKGAFFGAEKSTNVAYISFGNKDKKPDGINEHGDTYEKQSQDLIIANLNRVLKTVKKPAVKSISEGIDVLEELVLTDTYTGLKNKRALFQDLTVCIGNAQKNNQPFKMAMFDMDNFKSVNELLGLTTGDLFIKTLGEIIKGELKEHNIPAYRFGGEEFVVIFDKKNIDKADEITENILRKVNSSKVMNSKTEEYLENASKKIAKFEGEQADYLKIVGMKTKYENTVDLIKKAGNNQVVVNFLQNQADTTYTEWKDATIGLLKKSIETSTSVRDKAFLKRSLKNMENTDSNKSKRFYTEKLSDYFDINYNRTLNIAHIKNWVDCVKKPNDDMEEGFTATCGLTYFTTLDNNDPKFYVDQVGKTLANGKGVEKGKLYKETC